jgi:hypothetical protein
MTAAPRASSAVAVGLAVVVLTVAWPGIAKKSEAPIPVLPLSIAVARENGEAVRDDAWIDAQIAEAERLFGAEGVHFKKTASRALDERFVRLETRADRDALTSELQKGVVNVMIVESLRDVDDTTLHRMGVHWRPKNDIKKHYVIVAASAMPTTLAHELGHFFGNGHSQVKDNLMSYSRSGAAVFLDARQSQKIRNFARIYLRTKELVSPDAAPPTPPLVAAK